MLTFSQRLVGVSTEEYVCEEVFIGWLSLRMGNVCSDGKHGWKGREKSAIYRLITVLGTLLPTPLNCKNKWLNETTTTKSLVDVHLNCPPCNRIRGEKTQISSMWSKQLWAKLLMKCSRLTVSAYLHSSFIFLPLLIFSSIFEPICRVCSALSLIIYWPVRLIASIQGKTWCLCFNQALMFLGAATSHSSLKCISWKLSFWSSSSLL